MRPLVFIVAFLLAACATPLQVVGPYASRLSDTDIQQIKLLIASRPYIEHHLSKLDVVRPDKIRVETGGVKTVGWTYSKFTVIRRGGKWVFDESAPFEAEGQRIIVTDG
jgi:hypothetical protein